MPKKQDSCSVCGGIFNVTAKGEIRSHGVPKCAGTGKPPMQSGLESDTNEFDEERAAIQEDAPGIEQHVDDEFPPKVTPGPMGKLPVFGEVVPKGASGLNLQSEAQRRSVEAAKTTAKERTLPLPISNTIAALDAAKKRGKAEDITEKLTDSIRIAKMSESGELPVIVTENSNTTEEEDITMAAKKKTASKKTAKKSDKTIKTAAPIGRERKLLLRLSSDEYNALQAKAEKQGTSMAHLLRTSAIG